MAETPYCAEQFRATKAFQSDGLKRKVRRGVSALSGVTRSASYTMTSTKTLFSVTFTCAVKLRRNSLRLQQGFYVLERRSYSVQEPPKE